MKASFFGCSVLFSLGMVAAFSQGFIKTPESLAFVKSSSILLIAFACCVQQASPFEIYIHKEITQERRMKSIQLVACSCPLSSQLLMK